MAAAQARPRRPILPGAGDGSRRATRRPASTSGDRRSALVKLYADEPGADGVRRVSRLVVSQLARVDVPAALWRKQRLREIGAADAAVLVAAFEADYFGAANEEPRFVVLAVTAGLLDDAARLVGVHGLRAYDAVQLASAVATRAAVGNGVVMASFDKALSAAAAAEGLGLLPDT